MPFWVAGSGPVRTLAAIAPMRCSEGGDETLNGLSRLLSPASIAVIGASNDVKKIRGRIMEALTRSGYVGRIYPISRSAPEVWGLKAYAALADVPETVDLAIVAVGAGQVLAALEDCAAHGVGGALVFASGFAEDGKEDEQRRITELARRSGLRILGPNTLGFHNEFLRLAASFSPIVTERLKTMPADYVPRTEGGIDIVTQSGGLGFALHDRAMALRVPVRHVITTGNEADLDVIEAADFLLDQGKPAAILLFVEGFKDPAKLAPVARKAADRKVPLVMTKIGRSAAGQRAAISHTAHMTGADAIYDAVFSRLGILRVTTPEDMLSVGAVLAKLPPAKGKRVAIITTSGGNGGWAADILSEEGLEVPIPSEGLQAQLNTIIPGYGSSMNPIDVTAAVVEDGGAGLAAVIEKVEASGEFDAALVIVSFSSPGRVAGMRKVLEPILARRRIPIVFHSAGLPHPENLDVLDAIGGHYQTLGAAARGLRAVCDYGAFLQAHESAPPAAASTASPAADPKAPPQALLSSFGIPVPPEAIATSADQAAAMAAGMGFPVAMKIESADIAHKTDAGGVELGVTTEADCRAAYDRILANVAAAQPGARIAGVLIQKMVPPGIEMVVGMTRDADFGPVLMLGFGGVYVEILRDSAVLPAPVTHADALHMIGRLKGADILRGARGRPPADLDALADVLVRLSALVAATGDRFAEIDLNPVIVGPRGEGVMVVDQLFVESGSEAGQ